MNKNVIKTDGSDFFVQDDVDFGTIKYDTVYKYLNDWTLPQEPGEVPFVQKPFPWTTKPPWEPHVPLDPYYPWESVTVTTTTTDEIMEDDPKTEWLRGYLEGKSALTEEEINKIREYFGIDNN